MSGQKVDLLLSEKQVPGDYKYEWNADGLSSSVYLVRLTIGNISKTQKVVLIR